MDDITSKRLEKKLTPDSVRTNLILASMYLVAYELLKGEIVDKVKGFYLMGFDENGFLQAPEYDTTMLKRHKRVYEASCLWLADRGVLDSSGVEELQRIREHRDKIAHELPTLVIDPAFEVNVHLLLRARHYLGVLGKFWGSIEVDADPEFDGREVDYEGIQSGSMVLMDHILSVAAEFNS